MAVVAEDEVLITTARQVTRLWWIFLVTGIAWVLISFMVLAFKPTTPATIGYLTGFVLIAAGVNEFIAIGFTEGLKCARRARCAVRRRRHHGAHLALPDVRHPGPADR